MAFGMLLVLLFGSNVDYSKEFALGGKSGQTQGVVKNYRETKAEVNETEVVEYHLLPFLVFPLTGAVLAALGLRQGMVAKSLLVRGKLGRGVLVSKDKTNARTNNLPEYALTFRFRPENSQRDFLTVVKTRVTSHLEDDSEEYLLYDPFFPSKTVLLDNLPGKAHINPDGSLAGGGPVEAFLILLLPFLGVGMTVLTVLWL